MMIVIATILVMLTAAVVFFGGKAVHALQVFGVALTENAEKQCLATAKYVDELAEYNQRVLLNMTKYARAIDEHVKTVAKADEAITKLMAIAEGAK